MRFKDWLINEDFAATDSNQTGDIMYPTNAGDYAYAANDPAEHSWLQWKWDQEKKQGRKFHNINQKEFEKRSYSSVKSLTLPDKEWKHAKDNKPNLKTVTMSDLDILAIGKNSKDKPTLSPKVMIQWVLPLDKIFGDKNSGKWQDAAKNKEWKESLTGFVPVDRNTLSNSGMGVRSKYVGPDETGENDPKEKTKVADFGFDHRLERIKKKLSQPHKYNKPLEVKHVES